VGVLHDDGSGKIGARTGETILREDQAQVTEGMVLPIEANIGENLFGGAVVLDEGVDKHGRAEGVVEAPTVQVGLKLAGVDVYRVIFVSHLGHDSGPD